MPSSSQHTHHRQTISGLSMSRVYFYKKVLKYLVCRHIFPDCWISVWVLNEDMPTCSVVWQYIFFEFSLWIRKFGIVIFLQWTCKSKCPWPSDKILYVPPLGCAFDGIACVCVCIFMFWLVGCGRWADFIPERDTQNICSCFWCIRMGCCPTAW